MVMPSEYTSDGSPAGVMVLNACGLQELSMMLTTELFVSTWPGVTVALSE